MTISTESKLKSIILSLIEKGYVDVSIDIDMSVNTDGTVYGAWVYWGESPVTECIPSQTDLRSIISEIESFSINLPKVEA